MVGDNSNAGGLVGFSGRPDGNSAVTGALIDQSFATGNVSSPGINVQLGGLVGFNFARALITSSRATGTVTATAAVAANTSGNCSTGGCQYESAGGLVGQEQRNNPGLRHRSGVEPVMCGRSDLRDRCGHVGSHGQGGGLTGQNDGIINNAFATGAVTGDAGVGTGVDDHGATRLGGLSSNNNGLITNSFATGNVGAFNVANLQVGGLVSDNSGQIDNSTATGQVRAGDYSNAGGLTSSNGGGFNCNGCSPSDGSPYVNLATISNSHATGDVTVGAVSLAGGLASDSDGHFSNSFATGAVTGGGNSILGGFIGITDITAVITNSTASGAVSSTGPNSWVGGFIGMNGGTINTSHALGTVTGRSDSLLGGFAGINLGLIQNSTTAATSTVAANGANNFAGGFVGVNFGSIDPSTSAGNVTGGVNNVLGSFVGANASLTNPAALSIPGSSFPVGTISTGSGGTGLINGTAGAQVGTTNPTSLPTRPSLISLATASCSSGDFGLCSSLQAGLTLVNYSVANAFATYGTAATVGAVTPAGLPNGVTATVTVFSGSTPITLDANTPAGIYTEKVTALSNLSYTIASSGYVNGTLTVNPATLLYVANPASIAPGNAIPSLTGSVTGFAAGDSLSSTTTGSLVFSTLATPSSNVGSYAITGSGLTSQHQQLRVQSGSSERHSIHDRGFNDTAATAAAAAGHADHSAGH